MTTFLALTVVGTSTGCIYALTASGLVVTYTTSGIFNFAHGAIGMIVAFSYWDLSVDHGWPQWLALPVCLLVIAPLLGATIERVLIRRLRGGDTGASLVTTLGLLLTLLGAATLRWDPKTPRTIPQLFAGHDTNILGVVVTYHQLTMMAITAAVAVGLRLLLFRTNVGIAMRGVVDDPELAALNGSDPDRVAAASWAIGASLAGLAGILLAPLVTLDIILLTLLVVNGYAAAMVGRLRSLPLTFLGGIALGLAEAYVVGEMPADLVSNLKPALPTIMLFVVLLVLPPTRLQAGRALSTRRPAKTPTVRGTSIGMVAFMLAALVASSVLSVSDLGMVGQGVVFAIIMLSLVLLVGFAGQVSLAQMTFVGFGAYAAGTWFGGDSVLGLVAGMVLAGAVGALAALPALRLQGLYLALSTLAFAQAASTVFFRRQLGTGGRLPVGRPSLLGLSLRGDRAFFFFVCTVFALVAVVVVAVRASAFGRRLVAMKDSPAACATVGINLTVTKLLVFSLSAAIAGLAGGLLGGLRTQVGTNDFELFQSLAVLLLAYISGIGSVAGVLAGGLSFGVLPRLQDLLPSLGNLSFLGAGIGAIGVARNPNGWTSDVGATLRRVRRHPATPGTKAADLSSRAETAALELAGADAAR